MSYFFKIKLILLLSFGTLVPQVTMMQQFREATVAIGFIDSVDMVTQKGTHLKRAYFRIVGTGVLFGIPDTNKHGLFLVTAKHVFYEPSTKWFPEKLRIRFSWFDDKSVFDYMGSEIILKKRDEIYWMPHPDESVDLAIMPIFIPIKEAGRETMSAVPISSLATEKEAFEGANVLVFGYPGAVGVDYWSKPLVRQGIISYLDERNLGMKPILIDAMVFPGNSGGPVFTIPIGLNKEGRISLEGHFSFLGIVSKAARQPTEVEKIKLNETTFRSFDYMGIGIVEPANRVRQMLELFK